MAHEQWHTYLPEEVLEKLGTPAAGMSSSEVSQRLDRYCPNVLQSKQTVNPWKLLFDQFKNVLIITLLLATVLSVFLGHGLEAAAIAVIVLFAVLLGFIQEFRAEKAIDALRSMAAPQARVLRDGREQLVAASEVVPGDMLLLGAGDRIAADARLVESLNLRAEEASLTGESLPSEKDSGVQLPANAGPGDRRNMVFAGTSVSYGRGSAVVVATGMQTEFGRIATLLQQVETEKTPLQKNLDKVGAALARAALVIVLVIVLLGLFRGQPFIEMLIFGIALAVAVVPEALPAVVTISLALGVQRMVKRNALMRRLPVVETLGSTTVICSDKTGTLTRDEMSVRAIHTGGVTIEVSGSGYIPEGAFIIPGGGPLPGSLHRMLSAGVLCSDALLERTADGAWTVNGDPTEGALVVAAVKAGLDIREVKSRFPRIAEQPFSSETKRMMTVHEEEEGGPLLFVKGAPEVVLEACSAMLGGDGAVPLDETLKARLLDEAETMGRQALRVLALAEKPGATLASASGGLVFLCLAGMIDPPRAEAAEAVRRCIRAGIRPVMITGDHPVTAEAIARELGILREGRVVTGAALQEMGDEDLQRSVADISVFARVAPEHKLRIVESLQKNGEIVAITGDGVNDAPALKKADIGISMGITGTDVSKEASAMMLTDDNFASIVAAIEEGRGIYDNIRKYLTYLLSSNIGELGLMAGASLFGLPLPLTAVQILYVNLATDGLPALALAVDPPEKGIMQRLPNDPRQGIFTRSVLALMLCGGIWSTIVNMSLFHWALHSGRSLQEAMTMTFVSLVLIQFFKAYNFRSETKPLYHKPFANRWLNLAIMLELLLLAVIITVPFLQKAFSTFCLTPEDWIIVLAASVTVIPAIELVKLLIRRKVI